MIKNIFLPERSGQYYLFSSRTIGISIGSGSVTAVQMRLQGRKRIIEKIVMVPIENNAQQDQQDRTADALISVFKQLDRADHIISTLPSIHVMFKKLHVPFVNREKISQVIHFEVEPLLPFPLNQAVIDFMIISTAADGSGAEVLVAAAQKDVLLAHKALFAKAGIEPTQVTVDILSLYTLIATIPPYASISGNLVVLIFGTNSTCVTLIRAGTLSLIRTLPKGIMHLAKNLSTDLSITPEAALEELMRFGVDHMNEPKKHEAIRKILGSFFDEIAFTIQSFSPEQSTDLVIMLGPGTHISGLLPLATELLHAPCQLFNTQLILESNAAQLKTGESLPLESVIPLSAALRADAMIDFNLAPTDFNKNYVSLFLKQIITMLVLTCIVLGILGSHYFLQRRAFKQAIKTAEAETIAPLKNAFKDIPAKSSSLKNVIEDAQTEVKKEEETWFAFSTAARSSMLTVLLELKNKTDKEALGFVLERLTITKDTVIIKAHVRDYEALKLFEKSLQNSYLLKEYEPQRDLDFEMKITLPSSHIEES